MRAEFVDEVVFQTKGQQLAAGCVVPGDLLHHRGQATALGVLLDDNNRLESGEQFGNSCYVQWLESVDRDDGHRAAESRLDGRRGI